MNTFYAIDFETANRYRNSACSVGVVRFENGKETESRYSLIKPPRFSSENLGEVH